MLCKPQHRGRLTSTLSAVLVLALSAAAADHSLPLPAPTITPLVPEGEKSFYDKLSQVIPGVRHWVMWKRGTLLHCNTTQSVGDGSGMYVFAPAGTQPGWLTAYDTGALEHKNKEGAIIRNDFTEFKGLCFWVKGDGSDAMGVLTTNAGNSKSVFRFPLKNKHWHKLFASWDKWQQPLTASWWFLTYGLERPNNEQDNWYIVDRVHLYKDETTEQITPTPDNDPAGSVSAELFVSGRENITRTLAKLKEKAPVKIVIAGDSLVTAAQLWYFKESWSRPNSDTLPAAYWWVLGERLKAAYGYERAASMLRTFNKENEAWADTITPRPEGALQVIAVATGGWTAKHGWTHLDQVLNEKPDLVIWEYGANDAINGKTAQYVEFTEKAVSKLKASGCEVILQTLTTSADLLPHNWLKKKSTFEVFGDASDETRRIARENSCAVADMYKALSCRGAQFVGDLHSDQVHLNDLGHEMFADVLDTLLTQRQVRIWRHVPVIKPDPN